MRFGNLCFTWKGMSLHNFDSELPNNYTEVSGSWIFEWFISHPLETCFTKTSSMLVSCSSCWIIMTMSIIVKDQNDTLTDVQMVHISLGSIITEGMRINTAMWQNCKCIYCLFLSALPFWSLVFGVRRKTFIKFTPTYFVPKIIGLLLDWTFSNLNHFQDPSSFFWGQIF
jgi:hypothetical protein